MAFGVRVVGGYASQGVGKGLKVQAAIHAIGQTGEPSLAIGVGCDLEIQLVRSEEAVAEMDSDLRIADRRAVWTGSSEFDGARACTAVNRRYRILTGSICRKKHGQHTAPEHRTDFFYDTRFQAPALMDAVGELRVTKRTRVPFSSLARCNSGNAQFRSGRLRNDLKSGM
jgi:hypothetical protein